jgi:hypothetical protein
MIRLKCPKCEKRLAIDDSKAGGVGACPACGQKFRVPGAGKTSAPISTPAKAGAAKGGRQPTKAGEVKVAQPPARPKEDWEEADSSPYLVIKEPDQPPPKEVRHNRFVASDDEMDDEGVGLDPEYLKQKREKRRKVAEAELIPGLTISNAILIGLVIIWLALGAFAFLKPQSFVISLFLGWLVSFAANIWFLVIAFTDDGLVAGICCIFVPFYNLYYLATHWEREGKTFRVGLMGFIIVATGITIAQYKGTIDLRTGSIPLRSNAP